MAPINLLEPKQYSGAAESFETLLHNRNVTIERILSPAGTRSERFVQEDDEWVCLLQGEAELEIAGEIHRLQAGEACFIPASTPHRVTDTSGDPTCIWLAVHIR